MAWKLGYTFCPAGRSCISRDPISPQTPTVNPVDDQEMGDEQNSGGIPPAARRFLERHRPAGDIPGRADRGIEGDDDHDDDNNEARNQHEAEGELEVEGPEVGGGLDVVVDADPGVPLRPTQHFAPRPRAKGAKHPPLP